MIIIIIDLFEFRLNQLNISKHSYLSPNTPPKFIACKGILASISNRYLHQKKRSKLRGYTQNKAHKIHQYLTPEERNYWWRNDHNLTSIKKTESKFERDKNGNLLSKIFPICNTSEETRDHYNFDCPQITTFRRIIVTHVGEEDFTKD